MKCFSFTAFPLILLHESTIYTFIALAPKAPNMAEATAITTFKILSKRSFS